MKRIVAVRKSTQCFGRGTLTFLRPANRSVLVYLRQCGDEVILCVANLSRSARAGEIDLSAFAGRAPLEMLGRTSFPRIGRSPFPITLAPYGFFWFQLCSGDEPVRSSRTLLPAFTTLVWTNSWASLRNAAVKQAFESDALPTFLRGQRWFAGKEQRVFTPQLKSLVPVEGQAAETALAVVDVAAAGG